jgi:RecA/RadA recombinase
MSKKETTTVAYKPYQLKVRLPIATVNMSSPGPDGRGGLGFSSIVEVYGDSRAGKSTIIYQAASYFLKDFKDKARLLIMSVEGYPNSMRLKMAFGIDIENDSRISTECTTTIEESNDAIQRHSKKCKEEGNFLFIIWDSISASSFTRAKEAIDKALDTEEGKDGSQAERGMTEPMARAQILKWCLNNTLHAIYQQPIILFLINQVTTKVNQFQASKSRAGGYALNHNVEERIKVDFVKFIGGDGKGDLFKTGTLSKVTVEKSRSVPGFQDIPIRINDQDGGVIEEDYEIPLVASSFKVLEAKSGGWYQVAEEWMPDNAPEEFKKSKQLKDIQGNSDYLEFLKKAVVKYIRSQFKLVDYVYKENGL